jgi:hypothetical protein
MLQAIGLALAGRAGARLAQVLGIKTNRSTLLRLLRALPSLSPPASLCWAWTTSRCAAATTTAPC